VVPSFLRQGVIYSRYFLSYGQTNPVRRHLCVSMSGRVSRNLHRELSFYYLNLIPLLIIVLEFFPNFFRDMTLSAGNFLSFYSRNFVTVNTPT